MRIGPVARFCAWLQRAWVGDAYPSSCGKWSGRAHSLASTSSPRDETFAIFYCSCNRPSIQVCVPTRFLGGCAGRGLPPREEMHAGTFVLYCLFACVSVALSAAPALPAATAPLESRGSGGVRIDDDEARELAPRSTALGPFNKTVPVYATDDGKHYMVDVQLGWHSNASEAQVSRMPRNSNLSAPFTYKFAPPLRLFITQQPFSCLTSELRAALAGGAPHHRHGVGRHCSVRCVSLR